MLHAKIGNIETNYMLWSASSDVYLLIVRVTFHEVQNVLFYHFIVGKAEAQRGFQRVPKVRVGQLNLISREARIPVEPYL